MHLIFVKNANKISKKTKKMLKLYNMTKKETRPGVNCAEVCNPQATTVEVGTG